MKTKFFFFLAMLLMSSVGAFAQSETNTPLKGDLNEDGEVDAADITVLVDIIMKKNVDPNKYYWYIGTENPSSISNVQTDNTVAGWHEIGSSLSGFEIEFNPGTQELHLSDTRVIYNVIIPEGLNICDSFGDNGEYMFTTLTCNIPGYKAFRYIPDDDFPNGVRDVTGLILKGPEKYYWYSGQENPMEMTSISPIKTDYESGGGWFYLGTAIPEYISGTVKGGENGKMWYDAIPTNANFVPGGSSDPDATVGKIGTVTLNGVSYDVWESPGATSNRHSSYFDE